MAYYFIILLSLISFKSWGAGCCSSSSSLPNLITGEVSEQFKLSYANSSEIYNVDSQYNRREVDQGTYKLAEKASFSLSSLVSDYFQAGVSINFIQQTYKSSENKETESSLGDSTILLGHEFMPEYYYSRFKPRGFVFVQHSFLAGKSEYNNASRSGTDIISKGYEVTSLGISLIKNYQKWNYAFTYQYGYGHEREYGDLVIRPKGSQTIDFNIGSSFGLEKFSFNLGFNYYINHGEKLNRGIDIDGQKDSDLSQVISINLGFGLDFNRENSLLLNITDQSLFNNAKNTALTRSIGMSYIYKIEI